MKVIWYSLLSWNVFQGTRHYCKPIRVMPVVLILFVGLFFQAYVFAQQSIQFEEVKTGESSDSTTVASEPITGVPDNLIWRRFRASNSWK